MATKVVDRADLGNLLDALRAEGFSVLGPTVRDKTITYGPLTSIEDLPIGWTDEQEAGTYRLVRRDDDALFGYVVGPNSWKRFLFPPRSTLLNIERRDGSLVATAPDAPSQAYAFIGVRPCEMAAIGIQDVVFLRSGHTDRTYADRRRGLFTVGVNCAVAGGTCFCVSMETGPRCGAGFDLSLTEVIDGDDHHFVFESGSEHGAEILAQLPGRDATVADLEQVDAIVANTAAHMGRQLDTTGLREALAASHDSPHWDVVADRCLTCTNCTLVCPTCFCSTVEDDSSLDGSVASRNRRWDSCFTLDFSALHGSPVRSSTKSRYRQWMTHKLSSWFDQFESSGCVGCGRCITWCPVAIDLTKEADAVRSPEKASA
ncbi:MAG: 4Fe-4S dicluster domain-containing protein [Acidimicrobiia bacterium]|nr:4Fe-4S dicluster domain-containing protein [Acidimicrobiia bacterium]